MVTGVKEGGMNTLRSRDSGLDLTAISDDERVCYRGREAKSSISGEPTFSLDRRVKVSP